MKKNECEKYINYLTTSGLFSIIQGVFDPAQINFKDNFINTSNEKLKFIVNDPAAYFAIFFGSRGSVRDIFRRSRKKIKEGKSVNGFLFESVDIRRMVLKKSLLMGWFGI